MCGALMFTFGVFILTKRELNEIIFNRLKNKINGVYLLEQCDLTLPSISLYMP